MVCCIGLSVSDITQKVSKRAENIINMLIEVQVMIQKFWG